MLVHPHACVMNQWRLSPAAFRGLASFPGGLEMIHNFLSLKSVNSQEVLKIIPKAVKANYSKKRIFTFFLNIDPKMKFISSDSNLPKWSLTTVGDGIPTETKKTQGNGSSSWGTCVKSKYCQTQYWFVTRGGIMSHFSTWWWVMGEKSLMAKHSIPTQFWKILKEVIFRKKSYRTKVGVERLLDAGTEFLTSPQILPTASNSRTYWKNILWILQLSTPQLKSAHTTVMSLYFQLSYWWLSKKGDGKGKADYAKLPSQVREKL